MITTRELENLGLDGETATRWRQVLTEHATGSADETWDSFVRSCHAPGLPFAPFQAVYRALHPGDRPLPAWQPDEDAKQNSNLARAMRELGHDDVREFHRWSVTEKSAFWQFVVERLGIAFDKPATETLRDSEFFPGAELNIVESCFLADSQAIAIRFRDVDGQDGSWTYGELEAATKQVANSLIRLGLKPDDRVAIDMPMTPESVAIYLGIIYAGMAVVSIADSFAAEEIRARLRIAKAKLIFTQDVIPRGQKILPLYEKVKQAGPIRAVVLTSGDSLQVSLQDDDLAWDTFLSPPTSPLSPHPTHPNTTTNILFSSGTTGDPKAIPWTHLTPVKAAMDGHFHQDIRPGDVVAWPTNLGWMMGPWLIYAALINRATIALYCGSPIERGFGEFVADAEVTMLGLVPSLVKSWRTSATMEGLDWSSVRLFSSTGECSTTDDYLYLMWLAGFRPVIEYCGGTEIGGGYLTGTILQPAAPATFTTAALGLDFHIFGDDGKPAQTGEVFIDPVSIGLSRSLLNRDHDEIYFAACPRDESGRTLRRHGDEIQVAGDFYRALGRADDTMNLGGIKVSSAEIEQVVSQAEGVVESAAVARTPEGGGPSELVIFVVVSGTAEGLGEMRADMQQRIRDRLNPLFKITALQSIDSLPRTASNKVMRRLLRNSLDQL
jgi:acetyl-CoA synthetase